MLPGIPFRLALVLSLRFASAAAALGAAGIAVPGRADPPAVPAESGRQFTDRKSVV